MSIYEDQTPNQDPAGDPAASQAASPVETLLMAIKNENGEQKYATVEDALKGLEHSQKFIEQLKNETAELRGKQKAQDELVELFRSKAPAQEEEEAKLEPPSVTGMTAEEVVALLEKREAAKTHTSNMERVKNVLKEKYGAEYAKRLKEKTDQLGLQPELVDEIARNTPDALFKMFGIDAQPVQKATVGGANSQAFNQERAEPKRFNARESAISPDVLKWRDVEKRVNAKYEGTGS